MSLTCLKLIQTVCVRLGLAKPVIAFGNTDAQIAQLVAISEEEGQEQSARYPWESLQTEATFTTVATQVQGALSTIAPACQYIVNDTIWNRTLRRPVYGPKSEQDWQQAKAMQINGPFNSFRIIEDSINFYPSPAAGQTCAFEFISANWITPSAGGSSSIWTSDNDTAKLNDSLMILGTRWRWKQAKGLDYAEDFANYERLLANVGARDGSKPTLNMGGTHYDIQPGIFVPAGSW